MLLHSVTDQSKYYTR